MGGLWAISTGLMAWAMAAASALGSLGEGFEQRFGPAASSLFASATTLTSTGAVDVAHDSLPPLAGGMALLNMMLGEIAPGGVGSGLYGMLVLAIISVFIAGLMVGRTPEFMGKKITAKADETCRDVHSGDANSGAGIHRYHHADSRSAGECAG